MNTKGMKFLAVLAVLAMAFAACVVFTDVKDLYAEIDPVPVNLDEVGDLSEPGYTFTEDGKILDIFNYDLVGDKFVGTNIAIIGLEDDAKIAELGLKVKKTVSGEKPLYYSEFSGAMGSIAGNDKATASAAKAAPVKIVLLDNVIDSHAAMTGDADVTTKYLALDIDLGGYVLEMTANTDLGGVSSKNKLIYFNDNQIVSMYNGTIVSEKEYDAVDEKDIAIAMIQNYGPLTLGKENKPLTLDISKVTTSDGGPRLNLAVALLNASGVTEIKNAIIDAGDNVAIYSMYGASNKLTSGAGEDIFYPQSINGGTDTKGAPTGGVKTIIDGATIKGKVSSSYYVAGDDYGVNTIVVGADLVIKNAVIDGAITIGEEIYNNGDTVKPTVKGETGVRNKITIEGGVFSDGDILQYIKSGSTVTITGTTTLEQVENVPAATKTLFTIDTNTVVNYVSGAELIINLPTADDRDADHPLYMLTNKGTINLDKGASVINYDKTAPAGPKFVAYVNQDGGKIKYAGSDVDPKEIDDKTGEALNTEITADIKNTSSAIIVLKDDDIKTDDTKAIDISTKDVGFVGVGNNVISKMNFTVGASASGGSISFSGFAKVSGTITTTDGTNKQTVKLTDFAGDFTISKGSVIIDGKYHGIIEITSGTELKLAGEVDDDFQINYGSTSGTAKVIIEAGDAKALEILDDKSLIINSDKISLTVNGTLFGDGEIKTNGNITVNDGGVLAVDTIVNKIGDANAKKIIITANSGSMIAGTIDFSNDGKSQLIAYSGSDINAAEANDDQDQILGKDSASGTWSVNAAGTLTLDNYNGTYNLGSIDAVAIIVVGDNKITYAMPEVIDEAAVFFDTPSITTVRDTGSLVVEIDASKMNKASIEKGLIVLDDVTEIDSVELVVKVKGTNPTWDAKGIKAVGIVMAADEIDNSMITVDVLSTYTAEADNVVGIGAVDLTVNSSTITVVTAGTGIVADDIELKNKSGMYSLGKALGLEAKSLDVKGSSLAGISGGARVYGNVAAPAVGISVMQDSSLSIDGLVFGMNAATPTEISNSGIINLSGKTVILLGATVSNSAVLNIEDSMNVFGVVSNEEGTITNNGTITVFAKNIAVTHPTTDNILFNNGDLSDSYDKKAVVKQITIKESEFQNDGTLKIIDAELAFETYQAAAGNLPIVIENNHFSGTLTAVQDVDDATAKAYRFTLSNGSGGASITLIYDKALEEDNYTVAVSGKVKSGEDPYNVAKPILDAVTDKVQDAITDIADSGIDVAGGTLVNASAITNFGITLVEYGGLFDGNIISGVNIIDIEGTFDGEIVTDGAVVIEKDADEPTDGKVFGGIFAKGGVLSEGTIEGNIISEDVVVVNDILGNITVYRMSEDDVLSVTVTGKAVGELTYNTKYKATKDAETKTTYTAVLDLDADLRVAAGADPIAMVINLVKGADANETEAVVPGFFTFEKTDALATGKSVAIEVTAGTFAFPEDLPLPVGYAMVFMADSTIEVAPTATLDVSNAALKVSKDANSHFVTGTTPITDYGLVKCIMSFTIESGAYTIYSDVAYAVSNCEEGSVLKVEAAEAPINSTINVPKNVEVIVGDGCTMSFGTFGLTMSEGAKITLTGTGKVTFGITGKTADTTWTVLTVNGTIVYDDNSIMLEKVRFSAASEITGVAATESAESKIKVDFTYKDGTAALATGNGTGSIVLQNASEVQTKGADAKLISGKFAVASDAVFEATKLQDAAYATKDNKGKEDTALATIVVVSGTLKLLDDVTVLGSYLGDGSIVLADNKTIAIKKATAIVDTEDEFYGAVLSGIVCDSALVPNTFAYNLVYASTANDFSIKAVKDGTKQYIQMSGELGVGIVNAQNVATVAALKDLKVCENASIKADTVDILPATGAGDSVTVKGAVIALDINKDKTGYGSMKYDTTYEDDDYTVYTVFENIDFEVAGDVIIADNVLVGKKLDLSGNDVNITIAKDKTLTLEAVMIIGTPITVLGDGEGSSIVGKVVIKNDVYLVAYSDVDLTEAEIIDDAGTPKDAVFSKLDVENVPYALIFAKDRAEDTVKLSKADATLIPEIVGYNFTAWVNYNGDASAKVGETNAYADSAAILCTVMVKYVAGVDYYMNGVLFNVYDIPTDVAYGSYFTAKISDTTKYQGNPLINGQKTVCVDDDMELVASGVTPIPEPEPEPVIGDSGISLTDILLIVLVVLIAIMVVILVLRLNRS